ncbi:Hypothetical predicted protein [Octopus vulgaris]|uniref:Uncharacterized protein n=1 Tax=Octopus vulgaris TaxID=6645 RepID=A0AA36B4K8_OCTVU|nr:Hypothetical predicted protein [Octopus vulgaris]
MDTLKSMSPYKEKVSVYLLQEPTQNVSLSPFKEVLQVGLLLSLSLTQGSDVVVIATGVIAGVTVSAVIIP